MGSSSSNSLQIPTGNLHREWSQALHGGVWWKNKTQQAEGFRQDIKKNFYTLRTVKQWIGFTRKVFQSPSSEVFKTRQPPSLCYWYLSFELGPVELDLDLIGLETS